MESINMKYIIREFQELYDGDNWLDETFQKKLKDLTEEQVFQKPFPYVHSIAEVVSHLVEWRIEILRRLQTGSPNQLPEERDWIDNETLKADGWEKLFQRLKETQQDISDFLSQKNDDFIDLPWVNQYSNRYLLAGLTEHDAYHMGQIGLIMTILRNKSEI